MQFSTVRRWLLRLFLLLASLVLAGWIVLQTQWGRARVRDLAIRQTASQVDGVLTIDRLEGSLWSDATVRGLRVTKDGQVILAIERVSAEYSLRGLIGGDLAFSKIEAEGVNATIEQKATGWTLRGPQPRAGVAPGIPTTRSRGPVV